MVEEKQKSGADRRDFLKLASLGTIVGGATVVTGKAQAETVEEANGSGYRETMHVKTYYELSKF